MGHAGTSMDDLYDMAKDDETLRKTWAEKCGVGFESAHQLYRMYRKNRLKRRQQKLRK